MIRMSGRLIAWKSSPLCAGAMALILVVSLGALPAHPAEDRRPPVPLIFDTDIGNDVDDALALGVIHALMNRGECELLAVTITKDDFLSAQFVDAVNTFYGRGKISIGIVHEGAPSEPSKFTGLANVRDNGKSRFPHDVHKPSDVEDAVALLRRTLAGAQDHSVVIVQVGFSTNLARLLSSTPDKTSPLPGTELVRQKVRLLSIMAGAFEPANGPREPEYNVKIDVPSAKKLVADWPTPIVFSGFEIGLAVTYPAESILRDFNYVAHHPLPEAYTLYMPPPHERPCWDLTSVLVAVRTNDSYFDLSPPGRVLVTDDGVTNFEPQPDGPHRYLLLTPEQKVRVREALRQLSSEPPSVVHSSKSAQGK